MKSIFYLTLFLTILPPAAHSQIKDARARPALAEQAKEFRVSQIGNSKEARERFLKLWESLQTQWPEGAEELNYRVLQAVGTRNGLQLYRVRLSNGTEAILQLSAKELLERAFGTAMCAPDGVHDATTVIGAAVRHPRWVECLRVANLEITTREQFLADIRDGKEFKTTMEDKCPECFGDGKLNVMKAAAECRACRGKGVKMVEWLVKN